MRFTTSNTSLLLRLVRSTSVLCSSALRTPHSLPRPQVVIASYTANLASFLVVTSRPSGINSLQDLANDMTKSLCVNSHEKRDYYEAAYPRLVHRIHLHHESELARLVANGICS
jgi:hypothetical protein